MPNMFKSAVLAAGVTSILAAAPAMAGTLVQVPEKGMEEGFQLTPDLIFPAFDAALGRKLFAAKGCVVCHEVNGIGGTDGPPMTYGKYDAPVNAMGVATDFWNEATTMIPMQKKELSHQIELAPAELAGIIAFLASPGEQAKFSKADIPEDIQKDM